MSESSKEQEQTDVEVASEDGAEALAPEPDSPEKDSPDDEDESPVEDSVDDEDESPEQDPVEVARAEAAMVKDRWLRVVAEFDNYKKRTLREREALVASANEALIRDLLPVLDSADRAHSHADDGGQSEAFEEGIRMILEELPKILADRGLEEIEAKGKPFDPNIHEALMQIASEEEAGTVAEVIERGYSLGGKVLRHAKVVVSEGPPVDSGDG